MKRTHWYLFCLTLATFFLFPDLNAQIGRLALSPLQTIEQRIAKTDIKVTYSRPAMRGREIFGGLVPYKKLWRTGANRSTKISFSEDVMLGDSLVQKGQYELFTKPDEYFWDIYLYKDDVNWDVPEVWDEKKIAATIKVPVQNSSRQAKSLNISLENLDNHAFDLMIHWDKTYVMIPVKLTTATMMNETISDVLDGPDADDYYLAAQYHLESETNLVQALSWIQKAIKIRPDAVYWDYSIQSRILLLLDRKDEAIVSSKKGLELAKSRPSEYGIREHNALLGQARK